MGEARWDERITGSSDFAREFQAKGPKDSRGRSLRDFDLEHRLFKYPLSFQIYSEAFDALPEEVRARVFARLREILSNEDDDEKFAHLSRTDRRAIRRILRETKRGLPDDF